MPIPQNDISNHQAKGFLNNGIPLIIFNVSGVLQIEGGRKWENELLLKNCIIDNLVCLMASLSYV